MSPGANVTFTAQVTGVPEPTITWSKADGKPLPTNTKKYAVTPTKNGQSQLTITGVEEADFGAYLCAARNTGGAFQAQFTIQKGTPRYHVVGICRETG